MAKSKQRSAGSAVQRREQMREQRQQRMNANNTRTQSQRRGSRSTSSTPLIIGGILLAVVIIVGIYIFLANQPKPGLETATPQVFSQLTRVDKNTLDSVGSGSVDSSIKSLIKPVSKTPGLKGPDGKPELFYMGGEFCPYCAAQRWSMIIALSHFGKFDKPLTPIISSESNVPTYSFYQGEYTSNYIDFVPVEVKDNQASPQDLEKLSPEQEQLVNKYDAPPYTSANSAGSFPFLDFGNQYVSAGAYYSPDILVGKKHDEIVKDINDPSSDISRAVLGSANYMTATICNMTNNQPGNVCATDTIQQLEQKLKQLPPPSNSQSSLAGPMALITSRRD